MTADQHDAGGRLRMPLLPGVRGDAQFVGERLEHRLWLERRPVDGWPDHFALCCGMNPSTAGADSDDLTVRKDQVFARGWGYLRFKKVNVGSFCSTDPAGMDAPGVTVNHPDNLPTIRDLAAEADLIVMACGQVPDVLLPHARTLFRALKADGRRMMCLGTTLDGWPRHSSRLAYATALEEFRP